MRKETRVNIPTHAPFMKVGSPKTHIKMNEKKQFKPLTYVLLISTVLTILFVACSKEKTINETSENLIESRLKLKPLAESMQADAIKEIFAKASENSLYFKNVVEKLDKMSSEVYINTNEGRYVAFFTFRNDTTRTYSIFGEMVRGEYFVKGELLTASVHDSNGHYNKYFVKNNEAFMVTLSEGVPPVYRDLDRIPSEKWDIIQVKDCEGRHGGTGFCQREAGETFGACHRAEVDEFTDSFIAWAYYQVNQKVVDAMIAIACGCSAVECKK